MPEGKNKKRELATNRLLELMRTQQKKTDSKIDEQEVEEKTEKKEARAPVKKLLDEQKFVKSGETSIDTADNELETAGILTDTENGAMLVDELPLEPPILKAEKAIVDEKKPEAAETVGESESEDGQKIDKKVVSSQSLLENIPGIQKKAPTKEIPTKIKEPDEKLQKVDTEASPEISDVETKKASDIPSKPGLPPSILRKADKEETPEISTEEVKKKKVSIPSDAGETESVIQKVKEPTKIPEKMPTPEIDSDLLQKAKILSIKKPKELKEKTEVERAVFDSSLFSTLESGQQKRTIQDYLVSLREFINDSQRKITIHCGEEMLRFLQVKCGFQKTEIEKFADYTLPYNTGDREISSMSDLLKYVLSKELDSAHKKTAFGTLFSSRLNTKTHIFQTPQLKESELADLVEWNAKKNLSFSPENSIINWEIIPSGSDENKNNVVVGIGNKEAIKKNLTIFQKSKLKLRYISTLPILLWKLFIHNYPDRKEDCYVLVHIGEFRTTIVVIAEQKLLFTREIAVGAEDFYKAVMQRIVLNDTSIQIDRKLAMKILCDFGVPEQTTGVIPGTQISLYKVSIFLRPVIERITSELNRSLNYFKKENPNLAWNELLFSGIGATFPNLLRTLSENLTLQVSLLNPVRTMQYSYKDDKVLEKRMIPNYTINFAQTYGTTGGINLLPEKVRSGLKYIFINKIALLAVIFFIPFYGFTMLLSSMKANDLTEQITQKSNQWNKVSDQVKEYFDLVNDIEIINGYYTFLSTDRIHSKNQIKIMKLLSLIVPKDIYLTSVDFKKEEVGEQDGRSKSGAKEYKDLLELAGFVLADPSVADIHLTNFRIKLEGQQFISNVVSDLNDDIDPLDDKLYFRLYVRF